MITFEALCLSKNCQLTKAMAEMKHEHWLNKEIFLKLELTHCNTKQPVQSTALQEKEAQKD